MRSTLIRGSRMRLFEKRYYRVTKKKQAADIMNNTIGMVFIHGAGLNSSIWNDLKEKIQNPVLTIEFPNRKLESNLNAKLTFDEYVVRSTTEIRNWQKDKFIIVAHSIGALVGLKVAEQFKNELK
ncbi:MAG: alpha/beta hydrolase, partial [Brumimicrobium sp.]